MALQSECRDISLAWRALDTAPESGGWRVIAIGSVGPCLVLAGRRFPAAEEALLVGFNRGAVPPVSRLPEAEGFEVCIADLGSAAPERIWIALTRKTSGRLDLFTVMVEDVLAALAATSADIEQAWFTAYAGRILAWQEFMRAGASGVLGPDAEVGLVGELLVLGHFLDSDIHAWSVIRAWRGPLREVHDFSFGQMAVEVKATVASASFPATISSLEQLEPPASSQLFLAAIRLTVSDAGQALPDFVSGLRFRIRSVPSAARLFDRALLLAGYHDDLASQYTRRFVMTDCRVWGVIDAFPRVTRRTAPAAVTGARYEMDLDRTGCPAMSFGELIAVMKGMPVWT